MTVEELRGALNDKDTVVLDVRKDEDWSGSDRKIAGAQRVDPDGADRWATAYYKKKTLVLYCA